MRLVVSNNFSAIFPPTWQLISSATCTDLSVTRGNTRVLCYIVFIPFELHLTIVPAVKGFLMEFRKRYDQLTVALHTENNYDIE